MIKGIKFIFLSLVSFSLSPSRFSLPDNPTNPSSPFSFGLGHSGHVIGRQEHHGVAQPLVCPSPSRNGVRRCRNRVKPASKCKASSRFWPPIWQFCRSSGPPQARPYWVALPAAHLEADRRRYLPLPARARSSCSWSSSVADESRPDGQPPGLSSLSSE